MKWPYENRAGETRRMECDVLVLGGGLAGCYTAIAAARKGQRVILVEKGATERSGAAGSGFDHWESACTNPCSRVTPEEVAQAFIDDKDGYFNGISHYIECREGYDRLLDMETFGGKIRDTQDDFAGAAFRDEKNKFLFAYDYTNRFTLRVWGSTFKPALARECRRLGVTVLDRTEATALLLDRTGAAPCGAGAAAMNTRTGEFLILRAKATVLCMSRPARVWLFHSDLVGLSEFRPTQCIGSGHAMGYRAGLEFVMMEKSVRGEFSAAGRSFPPYSAGNNHNTWYAATMVDARGVDIPYVDRDGRVLKTVDERYRPAPGQKFFLKGGTIDEAAYEVRGPETMDAAALLAQGYQLPFYADLSRMPEMERKVIWGLMVGEEGKTKIPVLKALTDRGFDPEKHRLQSYGSGWQSASFLEQERQLFGAPGGLMNDWDLKTNIDGIYAAGDQLFTGDCCGHAAATGYYAGRKAALRAASLEALPACDEEEAAAEQARLLAPLFRSEGMDWRELNAALAKAMQIYCGGVKNDAFLREGLDLLRTYREDYVPQLSCANPHELMRTHEVLDLLDVCELILNACLLRRAGNTALCFARSDSAEVDPPGDRRFLTLKKEGDRMVSGSCPLDYYGDLKSQYEAHNADYLEEVAHEQA
ncbi:MAG: FAD-dependent oxidoreductase [Eubacteriales bacterium]|nr:FAD-dependent oxidoreductase [Eubacteriales bacterium]